MNMETTMKTSKAIKGDAEKNSHDDRANVAGEAPDLVSGLLTGAAKWRRRALAFQEGYRDKAFEVTALELQLLDLRAHGADKVTARVNSTLRTKLLATAIERNELKAALRLAAPHVCSLLCPSTKRTGDEWTHVELCKAISAAIDSAPSPLLERETET